MSELCLLAQIDAWSEYLRMLTAEQLKIEVISDTICPWCYVGKRRLEQAIALLGNPSIEVEWKPFQLNPTMPREGMNRREYRTRKFGSWEHSRLLDAQVRAAGADVGIAFAHDKIERTRTRWLLISSSGLQGSTAGRMRLLKPSSANTFVTGAILAKPRFYWNWD